MLFMVDTLRANNIPVRVSDEGDGLGEWTEQVIMGAPLRPKFWIEIPSDMFEKANFMLQEAAESDVDDEVLDSHPFNDYSVPELQEVLVAESDWSPEAVVVARRLLLRRGGDVDLKRLRDAARARLVLEYQPASANVLLLTLFGVLSMIAGVSVWILGIMVILGILLYYSIGSRRDPKGNRHMSYDETTRKRSNLVLGVLGISVALGLLNYFYLHWVKFPEVDAWLWWWR